jgi:CelD/BcsL family acetyltransferase involved in cellulose biosynthesis
MQLEQIAQKQVNAAVANLDGINVFVLTDFDRAEPLWRAWQSAAHSSVFQTVDWCKHWMQTCGQNVTPQIVYGLDADGNFAFLLPFCIEGRCLKWMGQDYLIYGYGVYSDWALSDVGQQWFDRNAPTLVRLDSRVNRIDLQHMPDMLHGHRTPLLSLANCEDPDTSCILNLSTDYESLFAQKRSASTRAGIRNRDKRLAQLGDLKFEVLAGDDKAHFALEELLHDQAARLAENGIGNPVDPSYRKLLHRWLDADVGILRIMRLSIDDKSVASLLMMHQKDSALFLMVSLGGEVGRKFSPGDLALRKTIEHTIQQGYKQFDFSLGALGYKAAWTDVVVRHFHVTRAIRSGGMPKAGMHLAKHAFRFWFKRTPIVWRNFETLRRSLRGKAPV